MTENRHIQQRLYATFHFPFNHRQKLSGYSMHLNQTHLRECADDSTQCTSFPPLQLTVEDGTGTQHAQPIPERHTPNPASSHIFCRTGAIPGGQGRGACSSMADEAVISNTRGPPVQIRPTPCLIQLTAKVAREAETIVHVCRGPTPHTRRPRRSSGVMACTTTDGQQADLFLCLPLFDSLTPIGKEKEAQTHSC